MKNEVKKKMTTELRKSWHQSHDERVFRSKSQEVFRIRHRVVLDFPSANKSRVVLRSQGQDKNCDPLVQRGDRSGILCRDVLPASASIIKVTKSSREL